MAMGCDPDIVVVGMQRGEEVATTLRLVALCISTSIVFPWLDGKHRAHLRLFFLHWISGVTYVLSQFIMSVMVLNCWSSTPSTPFIYFLKFAELVALNLWSFSSVAIALLIASIVKAFKSCRRVPPVIGSPVVLSACLAVSLAIACASAAFWNGLLVTGGYFWIYNTDSESQAHWISFSFAIAQVAAGFVMLAAVIFIVTPPRRGSLETCCKASKRIKYYFILTLWGTLVYLYNGTATLFDEFSNSGLRRELVMIGWCSKYVHVIADTVILIGALKAQQRHWGRLPLSTDPSSVQLGYPSSAAARRPNHTFINGGPSNTVMTGVTYAGSGAASLPRGDISSATRLAESSEYGTPVTVEGGSGSVNGADKDAKKVKGPGDVEEQQRRRKERSGKLPKSICAPS